MNYVEAMSIQTQEEADEFFERLIEHCMKQAPHMCRPQMERRQRENIGYFAGYYDNETRRRVERLFKCAHPIFGPISENGPPTPEQAFEMGKKFAEALEKEKK